MTDLVSFIIPVFNRANIVLETLLSIQKQTYKNWECVLVDDHSTDSTIEVISNFIKNDARFQLYKRPNNLLKGANSCRNYALSKSKGNYIQFFDSDDLLSEEFLKLKMDKFLEFPKSDFILCGFKFFKGQEWLTDSRWNFEDSSNLLKEFLLKEKVLNSVVFLWKRDFLKENTFNVKLSRAQDLDFIFRTLSSNNFNFKAVLKELIYIRLHENSITGNFSKGKIKDINSEVFVRKNMLINNPQKEDKEVERKLLYFYLNTIKSYLTHNYHIKFFSSLFKVKKISVNFKLKLFYVGILHLFFGKGLSKYTNYIKPLK